MKHVGRPLPRLEDRAFLTGAAPFLADRGHQGELTLRVVRAPVAFGRLRDIDISAAKAAPGVVAVWTADDVADLPTLPFRLMGQASLDAYRQPLLARDMVRYVGEPVAAVIAETPLAAEDALDLVVVDVDAFEPALDAEGPTVGLTGEVRATEAGVVRKAYGDLHRAFDDAAHVVDIELRLARDGAMPLELRSGLAWFDAGRDVLHYTGAAKAPHAFRDALAEMLARTTAGVAVTVPPLGGSFGMRGEVEAQDVLACHAALTLARPVRWLEDRREHMVAAGQARGAFAKVRAGATTDGRLLALDVTVMIDQGAYLSPAGLAVPDMLLAALPGPYRLEAYRGAAHMRLTNKPPCGLMRGAGQAEAAFFRERTVDALAHALAMDPAELRRRNLIAVDGPQERRLTSLGQPVVADSGDYTALADEAVTHFALDLARRRAEDRKLRGDLVGVGTAFTVDRTGDAAMDRVTLAVDRRGNLELVTAAVNVGQGLETALAQIVADIMGVELQRIRVSHGSTARLPRGAGSLGAQTTALTGTAALYAAETLRAKILRVAGEMLDLPAERLTVQLGRVREADRHFGAAIELGAVAEAMEPGALHAPADAQGAFAEGIVEGADIAAPYGLSAAMVEVDPLTGHVRVLRAMTAYDVGNAVNPALVKAQLVSGTVQGIASALYTSLATDANGIPRTARLVDYAMPTAADLPPIEVLVSESAPAPGNPLGLKGAGLGGLTGVGAAIAAAVDDALGAPGFVTALPVRPEAIRAHLREFGVPAQLTAGAPVEPSHRRTLPLSAKRAATG